MIASEELEPGTGWSYTHLLTALSSDPAISIESLFRTTSDGMLWNAGQSENADLCTLSLVDLSATGAVEDALAALAVRAQRDLVSPDMARQITQARAGSLIFGGSDPDASGSRAAYERYCRTHGIPHQTRLIAHAGHSYYGEAWTHELFEQTLAFLET